MSGDPSRTLGKYRLIAEIARGGMGIVYLAMAQGPGGFSKLVVVKELKPELVEEPAYLQMFLDEARLAARLNHPNIVQTNEVGNDGERYFMAMDYLDGRGFDRVRRRSNHTDHGLTLAMQLRVISDVLHGLEYAHTFADFDGTQLGIVHRDVSPQNVFITFEGQVKLLDFGIAKTIDSSVQTQAGMLKGKLSYMAPEQARGEKVDARADVFSAGVLLWEALTGKRLSEGQSERDLMLALATADLPRASTVNPDVPPALDEICAKAMAWDRGQRYPSAGAYHEAIEAYLAETTTTVSARDVGAYISKAFHDDRAKTKNVIEKYVAQAKGEVPPDDLPSIDISYSPAHLVTPVADRSISQIAIPTRDSSASLASVSKVSRISQTSLSALSAVSQLSAAAPSAQVPIPPTEPSAVLRPPEPARSRSRLVWLAALVLVLAAGGVIFYLVQHQGHADGNDAIAIAPTPPLASSSPAPAPQPPAIAPTPAPAPTPPAPAQDKLIDLDVRVSPANAIVTIDGAQLATNPFHGKYVADGAIHQVKATAPGFVGHADAVDFTKSLSLSIDLAPAPVAWRAPLARPMPQRPAAPGRPAAPDPQPTVQTPPTPSPSDFNPTGGSKPHRNIDPTNPYGAQ